MIADDVLVKVIPITLPKTFSVIVNESKLSGTTALSTRQGEFLSYLQNGTKTYTTRSSRTEITKIVDQNGLIQIESFIKIAGDGTTTGPLTYTKLY